jgi:hypothetical protein
MYWNLDMKTLIMALGLATVGSIGCVMAQSSEDAGSAPAVEVVEASCMIQTNAIQFTKPEGDASSGDWQEHKIVGFACSEGVNVEVTGNREVSENGSTELVSETGEEISYDIRVSGTSVPSAASVLVENFSGQGLVHTFALPIEVEVHAADLRATDTLSYSNMVTIELFI